MSKGKAVERDYLAEDNAVAREFFRLLSFPAREVLTVNDICILVSLAAESRERAVKRHTATALEEAIKEN